MIEAGKTVLRLRRIQAVQLTIVLLITQLLLPEKYLKVAPVVHLLLAQLTIVRALIGLTSHSLRIRQHVGIQVDLLAARRTLDMLLDPSAKTHDMEHVSTG